MLPTIRHRWSLDV